LSSSSSYVPDQVGECYWRLQRALILLCGGGGGFTLFPVVLEKVKELPPLLEFKQIQRTQRHQ
jgi:hypothetical protein